MHVTRFDAAQAYEAPADHHGMRCLRLQGREAGPADAAWIALNHILPGGGTGLTASPVEKFYVVLDGVLTVRTEDGEATLGPWDSVRIAANEKRALENRTNRPVSVLLAMPYGPQAAG